MQSRICRFVAATASALISSRRVLLANSESTFVAFMDVSRFGREGARSRPGTLGLAEGSDDHQKYQGDLCAARKPPRQKKRLPSWSWQPMNRQAGTSGLGSELKAKKGRPDGGLRPALLPRLEHQWNPGASSAWGGLAVCSKVLCFLGRMAARVLSV